MRQNNIETNQKADASQDREDLTALSVKELDARYTAAYPVKSPTHSHYELLRREMIRRCLITPA